ISLIFIEPINGSSPDSLCFDDDSDSSDSKYSRFNSIINDRQVTPITRKPSFVDSPIEPVTILVKKIINKTPYDLLLRDKIMNNRTDMINAGVKEVIRGKPYSIDGSGDVSIEDAREKGIYAGMKFSVDLYDDRCQLIKEGIYLNIAMTESYHEQYRRIIEHIHILFGEKDGDVFSSLSEKNIPVQNGIYYSEESEEPIIYRPLCVDVALTFSIKNKQVSFDIEINREK
ncbi:MAG: hypothetical protein JO129_03600, partial [Candidatus Dependentiae bacterium]|nr:hypothetical protein [Candidatus Dependentiae bacterium]